MKTLNNRVERHIVASSPAIDNLCFASKNLYNRANYTVRQLFIKTSREVEASERDHAEWLRYGELDKLCKREEWPEYRALPAQTAQQTLRLLEKNWKSFFSAMKVWKKSPDKFKARPKLPGYKHPEKGRSIAVFTGQQAKLRGEYIHFPKKTSLSPLKTKIPGNLQQVRIIPNCTCYVIEVVCKKEIKINENLDDNLFLGIDLGLNNLATLTSNDPGLRPLIINGRPLKSMNQFFNKKKAKLMSFVTDKGSSNRVKRLTHKRNRKINDYLHKTSRLIVNYAEQHRIGTIVIGKNDGWKQGINIGKRNNQNFVQIPFNKLIEQIEYKAEDVGIKVLRQEESYTSKVDHLAGEPIEHHKEYLGKRVKRGLFRSSVGKLINADVNGAIGIILKAVPNTFANGIEAIGLSPLKINFS